MSDGTKRLLIDQSVQLSQFDEAFPDLDRWHPFIDKRHLELRPIAFNYEPILSWAVNYVHNDSPTRSHREAYEILNPVFAVIEIRADIERDLCTANIFCRTPVRDFVESDLRAFLALPSGTNGERATIDRYFCPCFEASQVGIVDVEPDETIETVRFPQSAKPVDRRIFPRGFLGH